MTWLMRKMKRVRKMKFVSTTRKDVKLVSTPRELNELVFEIHFLQI